jgi:lipopolysaccharide biosynthesis glycosyltransferase
MKIAFYTAATADYFMGLIVLLKSVKKFHGESIPFEICNINLNKEQVKYLKAIYQNSNFYKPPLNDYATVNTTITPGKYLNCNFVYDGFGLEQYDRVILLDSDLLITGKIDDLINCDKPFAAVPCWLQSKGMIDQFNSGVMVVNKPSQSLKKELIYRAGRPHSGGDQEILNDYFHNYHALDKNLNVEKKGLGEFPDAKIIHYVGRKPWAVRKEGETIPEAEHKFWLQYNDGLISSRNAQFAKIGLMEMISHLQRQCNMNLAECRMIEIGSYSGDSAVMFATHFKEVHCVDPWRNGYDANDDYSHIREMENVETEFDSKARCYPNITKHKMMSSEFKADGLYDFIYIDGLHTYDGCRQDIEHFRPMLKIGGVLGGHDYQGRFKGVMKAVDEIGGYDKLFKDTSWIKKA